MLHCGLLGEKLSHSFSPRLHALLGSYEYLLYECPPEKLSDFLHCPDWDGLNVTVPYKKAVVPYCDALSDTAAALGSVNTLLRRPDGSLFGDNTDAYGFSRLLEKTGLSAAGKKALVLGSGGASVTVCAVLRSLGAIPVVISRNGDNNYVNLSSRHYDAALLVNATPVGMYPNNGAAPLSLAPFSRLEYVIDLIYNPTRTALLLQAEALQIPCCGGLSMLVFQAIRSAELFLGRDFIPPKEQNLLANLRSSTENIALIGMPGCGKSTLARALGQRLGRPVMDSDLIITEKTGQTPAELIARQGEEYFRQIETEVLAELGKQSGIILSTGGGCVTREENYALLHQNSRIFWLQRDIGRLATDNRPLSRQLETLYAARAPLYRRFADMPIDNNGSEEEALNTLLEVTQ